MNIADIQPPISPRERVAAGCAILAFLLGWLGVGALFGGCKSFYENAGSRTVVGSVTAPIDISEPTSSVNVRALYSMDGADVYTAKDSLVRITYSNIYTNAYFGIVQTRGRQNLSVEIEPLYTGGEAATNAVTSATE